MTTPPDEIDARLRGWLGALLDGEMEQTALDAMMAAVAGDPAVARRYVELMEVHAVLEWNRAPRATGLAPPLRRTTPDRPVRRSAYQVPRIAYALAAALLLAAAAIAIYALAFNSKPETRNPKHDSPIATILYTADASTLIVNDQIVAPGSEIRTGEVSLDTGSAEFVLTNAVNVKLRGPTRMVMHDDMSVSLARGDAEFVCPTHVTGFAVHLPDRSTIVDVGTAFRVSTDDAGRSSVEVSDGRVELSVPQASGGRSVATLEAGEAASRIGVQAWTRRVVRMRVDLGVEEAKAASGPANPNDRQPGFVAADSTEVPLQGTGRAGAHALSASIGDLSFVVDDSAGTLEWRDRPAEVEGQLAALLEEFAFARNDERLVLRIVGLTVGRTYSLTTYHHDASIDVGSTTWRIEHNGDGGDDDAATDDHGLVVQTTGVRPALRQGLGMLETTFVARAESVSVYGTSTTDEPTNISILNGFVLTEHEPLFPENDNPIGDKR